jgi:hypothetical protein
MQLRQFCFQLKKQDQLKYFFLPALALIVITVLFSSCSLEKRQYTSGYYIDWNSKKTSSKQIENNVFQTEKIAKQSISKAIAPIYNIASESISTCNASIDSDKKQIISTKRKITETGQRKIYRDNPLKVGEIKISDNPKQDQPARLNIWSLLGFILSVLGVPLVLFIGVGAIPGIVGIVFSIIGLIQCKKHSDEFRGRDLAIAGLTLGIVAFVFGIIFWVFLFFVGM